MSEILEQARRKLHADEDITRALNKLEEMEQLCKLIYHAYHHGTEEELDKLIGDLIYKEEYDWSDEE